MKLNALRRPTMLSAGLSLPADVADHHADLRAHAARRRVPPKSRLRSLGSEFAMQRGREAPHHAVAMKVGQQHALVGARLRQPPAELPSRAPRSRRRSGQDREIPWLARRKNDALRVGHHETVRQAFDQIPDRNRAVTGVGRGGPMRRRRPGSTWSRTIGIASDVISEARTIIGARSGPRWIRMPGARPCSRTRSQQGLERLDGHAAPARSGSRGRGRCRAAGWRRGWRRRMRRSSTRAISTASPETSNSSR